MLPRELQMVGFPPSLIDLLLRGQLTEPLTLPFTSPLMAGRAKRGLYRLLRQYSIRTFKISQPDPCTLILQPTTGQKSPPCSDFSKNCGKAFLPPLPLPGAPPPGVAKGGPFLPTFEENLQDLFGEDENE